MFVTYPYSHFYDGARLRTDGDTSGVKAPAAKPVLNIENIIFGISQTADLMPDGANITLGEKNRLIEACKRLSAQLNVSGENRLLQSAGSGYKSCCRDGHKPVLPECHSQGDSSLDTGADWEMVIL
ncbi:hypothetical protein FE257_004577 [Aspergillus nanangensis]|uniref:Uncharacterized protein n=1 Tax=Aspergillus nanangensis TaxID=2582783 RepID=A0AAD4GZN8_ASPNN|nr:hypothetical protein FE257_004577 [Aspergillus nanangensis]